MNDQRFEHEVRAALDEAAPSLPPDRLMHAFEQEARRTRRRPRWLAHSKEPPMYYDSRLAVGSPQVRMVSIMAATLMLLLSLAAVGAGIYRLLQDEIVVDQSGNGDYTTISEALEAASDGTSIVVMPGTYNEYLDVTKDVSIQGSGNRSDVLIEYTHDGQSGGVWGYGLLLDEVDASIRNMEIRGPSDGTAIRALGGSLALEDVVIHSGPFALWTTGSGTIRNVVSYGLILDGAHDVVVEDSQLWCTVRIAGTSGVTFERSRFLLDSEVCVEEPANEVPESNLPNSGGNTREDSTFIEGDPVAYPLAVQVEAASPTFVDSTFELPLLVRARLVEAAAIGVRYELAVYEDPPATRARPVIEDNTFTGLETAISVFDSATPEIRENTFVDNGTAVSVGTSNAVLASNMVSGGGAGFALTAARPELLGNTVEGVAGPAVSIAERAGPILRDNVLCADGEVLDIADTATPDIDDSNEICEVTSDAIVVAADGSGDVTTITEALEAAVDGDEIEVMPGTYEEYLDVTKDVSITGVGERGEILVEYTHEGQDGQTWGYGARLDGVEVAIRNIAFRGPAIADGTAIVAVGGSLSLEDVIVHPGPNSLETSGDGTMRGVELHGATRIGRDSTFTVEDSQLWCEVHPGGGTFIRTEFLYEEAKCPEMEPDCCAQADPTGLVPGIWIETSSPTFIDSTFELEVEIDGLPDPEDPDAPPPGARPVIEGSTFHGLETAITVHDSATASIRENVFTDNATAVSVGKSNAIIEGNTVTGGGSGFVLTSVKPELTRNTVSEVAGPAVSITGAAAPILRDNTLCAVGEVLEIADTATPDIDESNEVC